MESTTRRFADIDFELLKQIDRDIDEAMELGAWSLDLFTSLYDKGTIAAAGNLEALRFLIEVAEPDWPVEPRKGFGVRRLPREIREIIRLLSDGWEPFLALPKGTALSWKDQAIAVNEVEVLLQPDTARLIANLRPETPARPDDFNNQRGIIRDTIEVEFAYGWKLRSSIAILTHRKAKTTKSKHSITYQFQAHDVHISHKKAQPHIWVIPLGIDVSIPVLRNVFQERIMFSESGWSSSSKSIGLRLQGVFSYVLLKIEKSDNTTPAFLIIENLNETHNEDFINHDILALQFALGQSLPLGLAYGLHGSNVTAVRQVANWASSKAKIQTIPLTPEMGSSQQWFVDFFHKLSRALQDGNNNALAAVLHLFLRSLDSLLDVSLQEILSGIAILSRHLNADMRATHGNRAKTYLDAYGISLPDVVHKKIDYAAEQLAMRGEITLGASLDQISKSVDLRDEIRTVLVAMISAKIGYRGPIVGDRFTGRSPSWWPRSTETADVANWSASLSPEDARYGANSDDILILMERPEHETIARWLLTAASIPFTRLKFGSIGHEGLLRNIKEIAKGRSRIFVIASSQVSHLPTGIELLRSELSLEASHVLLCPAVPYMEAWMLADDDLLRRQDLAEATRRRVLELLPEELFDARTLTHQIFGPPDCWHELPSPDVYRAAERSPSLRRFISGVADALGIKANLPAQAVSRSISRSAIAGLIRDLLDKDTIAWRTSDDNNLTAEALAREVEQGTETGRQYTVDLISMMINTLSRTARRKSHQ